MDFTTEDFNGSKADRRPSFRFPLPGTAAQRYIAVCDSLRETPMSPKWVWCDFTVPSLKVDRRGGNLVGALADLPVFGTLDASVVSDFATSVGFSAEGVRPVKGIPLPDLQAKERRNTLAMVAAIAGYAGAQAQMCLVAGDKPGSMRINPVVFTGALTGRRFGIEVKPHTRRDGDPTYILGFFPVLDGTQGQFQFPGQGSIVKAPPALGAPKVAAKPTFEQAAQSAGWEPHPDSADYYHNGVEAVEINVLRGMLGF